MAEIGLADALKEFVDASTDDVRNGKPILIKYQKILLHSDAALKMLQALSDFHEKRGEAEATSSAALLYILFTDANAYGIDEAYKGVEAWLRLSWAPVPVHLLAPLKDR